jgi:hypothetical protein
LFELGGAGAALAALLTACGGGSEAAPGRVGFAPEPSELPDEEPDDAVYLRTLTSLEFSIIAMYERFEAESGLDGASAAALERFLADHEAAAADLSALTVEVGGQPFECPNPWYEARSIQPALAYVFGDDTAEPAIPPSDDIPRDTVSMMHGMEALSTASYLRFVELLSTPELRGASARLGSQSARRAATSALISNPPPTGYVAPSLLAASGMVLPTEPPSTEATAPIPPVYAITTRYAQLTAVVVTVGAVNDLGLRYNASFETPAENAYVYDGLSC